MSTKSNRIKVLFATLACLALLSSVIMPVAADVSWDQSALDFAGQWPGLEDIEGTSWLVLDLSTGEVLIGNKAAEQAWPASTTKIMTAVLALESGLLGQTVVVSETAVDLPNGSSTVGFLAGEQVQVKDVLGGLMTASGNDAANILAEAVGGSLDGFVDMMNTKADSLGLENTHFTNPSGLHDNNHYTTAWDMTVLAAYAMQNENFRILADLETYTMPATNLHPYSGWGLFKSTNRLLGFGQGTLASELVSDFTGIKTGTTPYAGSNLVSSAKLESGHDLISVLFGVPTDSNRGNVYIYSRTLLLAGAERVLALMPTATPTPYPTATPVPVSPAPGMTQSTEGGSAAFDVSKFLGENTWRSVFLVTAGLLVVALMFLVRLALQVRRQDQRKG